MVTLRSSNASQVWVPTRLSSEPGLSTRSNTVRAKQVSLQSTLVLVEILLTGKLVAFVGEEVPRAVLSSDDR
jgi:hypothetical protein